MKKLAQAGVLFKMVNADPKEVTKHSKTVYEWRGIVFQICGRRQKTAPSSHYTPFEYAGKTWYVRELGDKSEIIKNLKRKEV